jgi:4-hydroxy-2-oxoglutarate aldolase
VLALANFAAVPLRRVYDAFKAGKMDEARRLQLSLAPVNAAVTSKYGVSGLKYAMDRAGFYGGPCRRPLLPASPEARAEIDRLMAALELE